MMNYGYQRRVTFGTGPMTKGVKYLLFICVGVFLLQLVVSPAIDILFGLIPVLVWKKYFFWQIGTYLFLHGSPFHLLFNLFALWMFGCEIERQWGTRKFLKYFFITGIGAGLCYALVNAGQRIPVVGASGAIYGILLAYGMIFPNRMIYVWFLFPIRAKYFVMIFGAIELYASITGAGGGIAHVAHLGGMLFGYIYMNYVRIIRRVYMGFLQHKLRKSKKNVYIFDIKKKDDKDQYFH
jgi:membrane associated rhomboid family serine protease